MTLGISYLYFLWPSQYFNYIFCQYIKVNTSQTKLIITPQYTYTKLHFHFSLSCIGEGNGNPLQCSCLENPRDGGAWWAAVFGVAQSRTRLKWFSSSSNTPKCQHSLSQQTKPPWLFSHQPHIQSIAESHPIHQVSISCKCSLLLSSLSEIGLYLGTRHNYHSYGLFNWFSSSPILFILCYDTKIIHLKESITSSSDLRVVSDFPLF